MGFLMMLVCGSLILQTLLPYSKIISSDYFQLQVHHHHLLFVVPSIHYHLYMQIHDLNKPLVEEEIEAELKDLWPWKAPGLDGIPLAFFQENWDPVRNDLIS